MDKIHLKGIIADRFAFFFENAKGRFYKSTMMVMRDSGEEDYIPIVAEESRAQLINASDFAEVTGECQTRMDGGRLLLFVMADIILIHDIDDIEFVNEVELSGTISRKPKLRVTPKGREISDFVLAVEGEDKSHYIPCIVWGLGARLSYLNEVGDRVSIKGRFQSREYRKGSEVKTTYEVSASKCSKLFESV